MTTKIQWAQNEDGSKGETWNPVVGCDPVSPGCKNCYAARQSARLFKQYGQVKYKGLISPRAGGDHFNGTIRTDDAWLQLPLRRRKGTTYFTCSMSDLHHERVPASFLHKVYAVMAHCQRHRFFVLTKRPQGMRDYIRPFYQGSMMKAADALGLRWEPGTFPSKQWPMSNIWAGTSVESQEYMPRVDRLRETPAVIRFVSQEPQLREVDWTGHLEGIDWVIIGGESGPGARPFFLEWASKTIEQCQDAGVSVFVKQLGDNPMTHRGRVGHFGPKGKDIDAWPAELRVRDMPRVAAA